MQYVETQSKSAVWGCNTRRIPVVMCEKHARDYNLCVYVRIHRALKKSPLATEETRVGL